MSRKNLLKGEVIVADIIGRGFYEIVDFSEFFVSVKCLKLFGKGWENRGHVTNCHHGKGVPINLEKWLSYKRVHLPEKEAAEHYLMYADAYASMAEYDNDCCRINARIAKAIKNQLGAGFLKELEKLIEHSECKGAFKIVDEPAGKFQQETDFGCITGMWVDQYSTGTEGDTFAGTIWIKLKNYKYLEMPFSC